MKENYLQSDIKCDNLTLEELRELYIMKEQEIILLKYTFPQKPSSDGYYHIYVKDETKKSGRKALKSKTLKDLREKVLAYEKGASGIARKTFKDVFDIVIENKRLYVKQKERLYSVENTILRIESSYKRYFSGTDFEQKFIDEITKRDIENICLMNLRRYDMKQKAFSSLRGILKSVFDYAFSDYLIQDNVYSRVIFKQFGDMLVSESSTHERVHSYEEVSVILVELHQKQADRPKLSSAWALELQILMGLRRGEIPPLQWSDITDTCICISKEQLTYGNDFVVVNHTKNHKTRYFPITDDLNDFLKRLKVMHDKYYPDSDYLFPATNKNGIITNRAVYSIYQKICRKHGIIIQKDLIRGPHSFRRNAITDVVNATNGNIIFASSLFGNTPNVAKQNYYTGVDLVKAKEVLDSRKLI